MGNVMRTKKKLQMCFGDLKILGTGIEEVEKVRKEKCLTPFLFLTITNNWNVALIK